MEVKIYSTVESTLHQRTKERLGDLLTLDLGYLAAWLNSELIEKPDSLFVNPDKEGFFPLLSKISTVLVRDFIQCPRYHAIGLREKDEFVDLLSNAIFKELMGLKPDEKNTIEEMYNTGTDKGMRNIIFECIFEFNSSMKENLLDICKLP